MLPPGLRARLAELYPGATIERVTALKDDESTGEAMKALGYGKPLRIALRSGERVHELVFHTARPDDFGHDRRADRVGNLVLAYDTYGRVPNHVTATDADLAHAEQLAQLLLVIHSERGSHPGAYTRAIRDLLGHGEGIFGLVDSYAPGPLAPRLRAIEEACLRWRWQLRDRTERLRRTHGDCHPFNILVGDEVRLLDASRGSEGDPADDVACLTINYLFFGVGHPGWATGLGRLWQRFWTTYLGGDRVDVLTAVAPFYAWRALVLASPTWYPHLTDDQRDRILRFAERALAAERFDPAWGAEAMA